MSWTASSTSPGFVLDNLSYVFRAVQNGLVQHYALSMLIGIFMMIVAGRWLLGLYGHAKHVGGSSASPANRGYGLRANRICFDERARVEMPWTQAAAARFTSTRARDSARAHRPELRTA